MDETTKIIYRTLSRHLLEAAQELRSIRCFDEQVYLESALREVYLIVRQDSLPPQKKIAQIRSALEAFCPYFMEQANCLCAEDLQELMQEQEFSE